MDLAAYLKKHDVSQDEFAQKLGCSQGLVSHWLKGRIDVTKEWAEKIELATGGEVSKEEAIFGCPPAPLNEADAPGVAA